MSDEFNELSVYRSDWATSKARWESTPWWQIRKRTKRYESMRMAQAGIAGNQSSAPPTLPDPLRREILENLGLTALFLAPWAIGALVLAFVIWLLITIGNAIDADYYDDQPLPKWAHVHGFTYTIDPSYISDPKSDDWFDNIKTNFCERLPLNGYPKIEARHETPDGGFTFRCVGSKDD